MSHVRSRAATQYSGGSTTTTSSVKGYSSTLRKSRILVFSLLYHVQHQILPFTPILRNIVLVLEMLQIMSLALEPAFTDLGRYGLNDGLMYFGRIRMPMPALADSGAHTAALVVLLVYLVLVIGSGIKLALMEEGMIPPPPYWLRAWGVVSLSLHQILYLPALSILFSAMHCGIVHFLGGNPAIDSLSGLRNTFPQPIPTLPPNHTYSSGGFTYSYDYSSSGTSSSDDSIYKHLSCGEGLSIVYLVLSSAFLCITICYFGALAFAEYGFEQRRRDKRNIFSHTLSRLSFFMFLLKTCATLYIQFSGHISNLETRAGIYQWVILLCFAGFAFYICKFVPFYRRMANVIYLAFFAICALGALISFVTLRSSTPLSAFIAFMALLVPLIALSFIVIFFRLRHLHTPRADKEKEFDNPYMVEIIARPAIEDNLSKDRIRSIFWRGLKQFPHNVDVQLTFMQYLLEDTDNFQMLTSTMEKVKKVKSKMTLDTKFLLHCIEKQRMSTALAMDGGVEEVSKILLSANHHAYRAKLLVKNFWESLLHEEDLLLMPNMVAKLEHEETAADRAFMKLRARFPQNVAVMRHYAQFLDEVKGDPDTAHALFKLAEETEQETSTRHIGRDNDKGDSLGRASGEDIMLEEMKSGRKDKEKEKEKSGGNTTPEYPSDGDTKSRMRVKKLQLDSGEFADDSPRKSSAGVLSPRAYSPTPHFQRVHEQVSPKKISKYDLFRFRQYRDQAELFRSHSVWKISSAINLTLLILLLNMVILFAATMAVLQAQTDSISQLSDMVDTRQNVALCISSVLRSLRYSETNDTGSFQQDVSTAMAAISYLANNTLDMYGQPESYGPVKRGWEQDYETFLWYYARQQASGNGYVESYSSALDIITEYTFWMQQAVTYVARPNGVDSLWNSTAGRFVLENGLTGVSNAVANLTDLYEDKGRYTVSILQKITITLLPLSFFLVMLLLWFLVRSAIREIQHERVNILRLFLAIPKDNILSIVSVFKTEPREDGEENEEDYDLFAANEDEVSNFDSTVDMAGNQNLATTVWMAKNSRLSMLRNFFLKFLISLLSGFFLVVIAAALILAAVPEFDANIRSINVAGQRRTLVSHLHSACMSLAYDSETTRAYPTQFNASAMYLNPSDLRSLINFDISQIQQTDSILKFGTHGASGIQGHDYLINLEYDTPCVPLTGYTYTCTGLNSLLVYVVALAQIVVVIPDNQLSFLTSQLQTLSDVAFLQLSPLLGEAVTYYRNVAANKVDSVRTAIIVIFVIIFPVLVVVNFILRPMVVKVKQEHKRTLRMLLMIPINVIDTTPSIKEYLDSLTLRRNRVPWYKFGMLRWGRGGARRSSTKAEKLQQGHDPLLQAFGRDADEALLVVSGEGTIEMVSLSTERILGYEKRQLLGHRIATLFDEKTNEYVLDKFQQMRRQDSEPIRETQQDLCAKVSGGEYIPVAITISSVKSNSKTYFGLFIKNISQLRHLETQMEKERAIVSAEQTKLKELLLNVFPKSIAEQLLIKGEGSYQPQLIAEEYKEATILFADIVGFTTMCSDLEPGALLLILDGIFTEWDALIEKHKLQKIKTIGDCFMAAGGVPDRTVDHAERIIDFAMEMTEALHKYNDTCQILKSRSLSLNIRIGINTGPVVAGIIGRSRMCFDLWGDAVNVASRMESTSLVGRIQVSQATFNRVKNNYLFEERGSIDVKGKGAMLTYLLVAPRFYRTESGKVIDNRFAQHLYSTPSGKSAGSSTAATPSTTSTSTGYSPGFALSPITSSSNNNNNPNPTSTPTINLTSSTSSNVIAEYNRNNRRSSLGNNASAFSTYNTNNPQLTNRRGSVSAQPNMRPIYEGRDDNNNNNARDSTSTNTNNTQP